MAYFGNAALTWSATSDSNTKRVHLLQQPLRELRPGANLLTFRGESLDRSKVDFFTVAGGSYELVGEVRYDLAPQSLLDLIRAGASGLTLTYYPNLADADTKYACVLMAPQTPTDLGLDPQRGTPFGEQTVTIRLRLTNQAAFQPLLRGNDTLFSYRAGESLVGASFTRTTSTGAPATFDDIGYGTLSTAKNNQARISWVSQKSSIGPRSIPVLRLEPSRLQMVKDSKNLGTANWTLVGGLTRSSGKPDPTGGSNAWSLNDQSTATQGSLQQQLGVVASSGQVAVSAMIAPGTTPSTRFAVQIATSSGGNRGQVSGGWSSGTPSAVSGTFGGKLFDSATPYRNGFYRVTVISASSLPFAAGKKPSLRFFPGAVSAGQKASLVVYGPQVE